MPGNSKEVIDLSSTLPEIWRMLSDLERNLLRENARMLNFKKNELIYLEDEIPKDLMCLFKGKVKIYKSGVGGRSQIIRIIRPVMYFGYRAYFARERSEEHTSELQSRPHLVCRLLLEKKKKIKIKKS